MTKSAIVIATPHGRNDLMEHKVRDHLTDHDVVRLRASQELTLEALEQIKPSFIFFPHWSWRIPEEIHSRFDCVIFHMTDLPYGRGGSPLQNLVARGVYETKISALKCAEEVDAGPVYLKRPLSLHGSAEEIYLRASEMIGNMIVEIVKTKPKPETQVGEPTIFKRRIPEQGNLLHAESLQQAYDLIRMLDADSYPSAFINMGKFRMEFTRASLKAENICADVKITLNAPTMQENK